MRLTIVFMLLAWTTALASIADQNPTTSVTIPQGLAGRWTCWDANANAPAKDGLLSIEFTPTGNAEWTVSVHGKTETRTGTYDFDTSENILFPSSINTIVRLHRSPLSEGTPVLNVLKTAGAPIYLVGVRVGIDNRFPVDMEVLHFKDAFHSKFTCIKVGQESVMQDEKK